jgi:hypothetical protein
MNACIMQAGRESTCFRVPRAAVEDQASVSEIDRDVLHLLDLPCDSGGELLSDRVDRACC